MSRLKCIRKKIQESKEYFWHNRTLQLDFDRVKLIHSNYEVRFVWALSKNYLKLTTAARSITQMIFFPGIDADNACLCCKCNMNDVNIVDHCISECPCDHVERVSLLDKMLQFNQDKHILFRGLDKETLTNLFLGEALVHQIELQSEDLALFWYFCLPALHFLWSRYHHVIVWAGGIYL